MHKLLLSIAKHKRKLNIQINIKYWGRAAWRMNGDN